MIDAIQFKEDTDDMARKAGSVEGANAVWRERAEEWKQRRTAKGAAQ